MAELSKRIVAASGTALSYCLLLAGAATMVAPFLWMVSTSLKELSQVFVFPPRWIPKPANFQYYVKLFKVLPMARISLNSLGVSALSTAGVIATASLAAYAFSKLQFDGSKTLFTVYMSTMMIPAQVTIIPMFLMIRRFGWTDTYMALVVPFLTSAYGTFLFRQFFISMPDELLDAARVDGYSEYRIYLRIVMPLSTTAIAALGMFNFMFRWNEFLWPLIVINSPALMTLPVGLRTLQAEFNVEWPLLMAGSLVSTVPTVVLFLIGQKAFVSGISLTGLKA